MIYSSQEIKDRFFIQDIVSDSETDKDNINQFVKKQFDLYDNKISSRKRFWYKEVLRKEYTYKCSIMIPKLKQFFDLNEIEKHYAEMEQTQFKLNTPREEVVPAINLFGEKSFFSFVEIVVNKGKKDDENINHPLLLNSTNDSQNLIHFQDDQLFDSPLNKPINTYPFLTSRENNMKNNFLIDITKETSLLIDNKNNFIKGCLEVSSYNFAISSTYQKCSACEFKCSQHKFNYCID